MKRAILLQILLMSVLASAGYSQQPTPPKDDEVVKVSTSLVQVDAIVTDKSGNPVTNLTINDFELWQDGKPQAITNLSYINREANREASTQNQTPVSKKPDKNTPLTPPTVTRSKEFGRILTFVVDDGSCDATRGGILAARDGLEKFVNEQMLPDDSVAIYQTRAGSALLQQYTSDKTRLLNTIRKIRWYPPLGLCNSITGDDYEPARNNDTGKPDGGTFESDRDKEAREKNSDFTRERQVGGLIGVLRYAIKGLYPVGGRKVIFLMADSLPLTIGGPNKQRVSDSLDQVRDLTNLANRASVVINSIDVRGLNVAMLSAQDDPGGIKTNVQATSTILAERTTSDDNRQSGLAYVAGETGGKFYKNMNNLDVPIQKALKSEKGYYLIGYQPEEEVFKGKEFHKIEIKLKNPDLVTSSRAGFYAITDAEMRPKPRTGDTELYDVLTQPLPNADMNIRLSAYFVNTPAKGNFIHAVVYIDGKDIAFIDEPGGTKKVIFDIVAVTIDDKNKVIDDSNHTQTVHIPSDKIEEIQRNGLIYTVDVPVKKEGIYTFRTALREATAKRIGSSSQTIEVPDLKKNKLLVSGLTLSGVDANGNMLISEVGKGDNEFTSVVSKSIPAIRQFQRNSVLAYVYTIYNAKLDKTDNQPKLLIQTKLYRDGKILSEGKLQPAQISSQTDMTRIRNFARLRINSDVLTGEYALQIIVKDTLSNQITSQWVDFEVVE